MYSLVLIWNRSFSKPWPGSTGPGWNGSTWSGLVIDRTGFEPRTWRGFASKCSRSWSNRRLKKPSGSWKSKSLIWAPSVEDGVTGPGWWPTAFFTSQNNLYQFNQDIFHLRYVQPSYFVFTSAVVVAQLVERSLPTPEIRGTNPIIGKVLSTNCKLKWKVKNKEKRKKRPYMAHLKK